MANFKCDECGATNETKVVEREVNCTVKGMSIVLTAPVRVCTKCGERVFDYELDQAIFSKSFALYRQENNVITPEEIVELREKYGLSQRSLAQLLGWGDITIHRYEKGSIPSAAHNHLLKSLRKVSEFRVFFEEHRVRLPQTVAQKLELLLNELEDDEETIIVDLVAQKYQKPSIITGFRPLCPERLSEMLVYFAHKLEGVQKTKVLKLCWYSDFVHYLRHSLSFSGSPYVRAPYGPVPDQYEAYINRLSKSGVVKIEPVPAGDYIAYLLHATRPADVSVLTAEAISVMDEVCLKLGAMSSKEISRYSHEEEGWKFTREWEPIEYNHADQLNDWKLPIS